MTVSLRPVTRENFRDVVALEVAPEQREFVADNVRSLAEAWLEPLAWPCAIYADEEPVGFLMLHANDETKEYFLWRFMIAAQHQGKGHGRRAIELLADEVRSRGGTMLRSSFEEGELGPRAFYLGLGFTETGKRVHDEVEITLPL